MDFAQLLGHLFLAAEFQHWLYPPGISDSRDIIAAQVLPQALLEPMMRTRLFVEGIDFDVAEETG